MGRIAVIDCESCKRQSGLNFLANWLGARNIWLEMYDGVEEFDRDGGNGCSGLLIHAGQGNRGEVLRSIKRKYPDLKVAILAENGVPHRGRTPVYGMFELEKIAEYFS